MARRCRRSLRLGSVSAALALARSRRRASWTMRIIVVSAGASDVVRHGLPSPGQERGMTRSSVAATHASYCSGVQPDSSTSRR